MRDQELAYHSIPRSLFDALANGGGGPAAIRVLLAAQRSKSVALLRGVLHALDGAGTEQARIARPGAEVLIAVESRDPAAYARAICYPSFDAWATHTLRGLSQQRAGAGTELARLATVAAAAAIAAGMDAQLAVRADPGMVFLPSLGAAHASSDGATVRTSQGRAEISWPGGRVEIPPEYRSAPGWQPLRSCPLGEYTLIVDDLDPFRMPGEDGRIQPRLGAREAGDWSRVLRAGYQLLATTQPEVAEEVALMIRVVVPLAPSAHGQLSSSSADAFGAIAMSRPPDPYTCGVTFAHELQHLKLSALRDIVPLTEPDDGRRYYAPWRDDPRPASGLLQGAYAHLGITRFWRAARQLASGEAQARADSEFGLWREGTARAVAALLASGQLTSAGADFVRGMSATIGPWLQEPVPATARAKAAADARAHLARWELNNGPAPA
ncbi:MAG TPA: HEXXH motif domain-containing protein [Trebonia sp.]|nr:HEXXH motif domain-containing protein [Trebonia sp.]